MGPKRGWRGAHWLVCLGVAGPVACGGRAVQTGSSGSAGRERDAAPDRPDAAAGSADAGGSVDASSLHGRIATYTVGGIALYPPRPSASTEPLTTLDAIRNVDSCQALAFDGSGNLYALCFRYLSSDPLGRVDVFAPEATGSAPPTRVITGPSTSIVGYAADIAVDTSGSIYVVQDAYCQLDSNCNGMVSVFAPGAEGDAAPVRVIQGPHTGINYSAAIAVDAQGHIYVGNAEGGPILEYAADANGDATPIRRIGSSAYLGDVTDLAIDAAGTVYATEVGVTQGVVEYGPTAGDGDTPDRIITGNTANISEANGVAVETSGRVVVVSSGSLRIFAAGASGDVSPQTVLDGAVGNDVAVAP